LTAMSAAETTPVEATPIKMPAAKTNLRCLYMQSPLRGRVANNDS
jgi:hypothetical protein